MPDKKKAPAKKKKTPAKKKNAYGSMTAGIGKEKPKRKRAS